MHYLTELQLNPSNRAASVALQLPPCASRPPLPLEAPHQVLPAAHTVAHLNLNLAQRDASGSMMRDT
jgi:hypothetical protein